MPEEWLTVLEAAERLGISREGIYQRVRRGRVETRRQGRWLYVKLPPPKAKPAPPEPLDPALLGLPSVAELLGATRPFVRDLVRTGKLPAVRRGRFCYVHPDAVAAYIEGTRIVPGRLSRQAEVSGMQG